MVLPGLVDAHVHCGHGTPEREDFACVSRAAAAGGTTLMVDMPLSEPTTVTVEALEGKIASAGKQSVVDFALYSGIIPGHLDDIESTFSAGAQTYKIFTCRCSNYPMTYDGALLKGMRTVGKLGGMVCAHAENDTLIQELVDDLQAAGRNDARAFLDSHPEYTELEAVNRFIFLAGLVPECRAHICHLSIADGVRAVREARGRGMNNLSIETCPQYLALDEDDLVEGGAFAKCDPPVRRRETVEELWKYVLDGTVDMIASELSPFLREKDGRGGKFLDGVRGMHGSPDASSRSADGGQEAGAFVEEARGTVLHPSRGAFRTFRPERGHRPGPGRRFRPCGPRRRMGAEGRGSFLPQPVESLYGEDL